MTAHEMHAITAADTPAIAALSRDAGWPYREDDVAFAAALGRGVVVREAGAPTACGLWWPWGSDTATLGMVIVRADRQGRGLGRALMDRLLADAAPRAIRLVATPAGVPLYERLDFRIRGKVTQYQGACRTGPRPAPGIRPARADDREALVALDSAAFGACRRRLLDALLRTGDALVCDAADSIAGFAVRRRFGRGEVIGPIAACDEETAIALLRSIVRPGFQRIDVPGDAPGIAATVTEAGLTLVDTGIDMVRGTWPGSGGGGYALVSQSLG